MCAAISEDGVVGCRPVLGSYNTEHLIDFLNELEQACQGNLCYRVGQYQFPPCRACSGMVSGTLVSWPTPFPILSFPQPNWGILLYMEVESVWSPSPWACHPSSSHGWSLWRYNCRAMSSLDSSCQKVFPAVTEQWRHSLWWWWKCIAKCWRLAW